MQLRVPSLTHVKTSGRWFGNKGLPSLPWLLLKRCVFLIYMHSEVKYTFFFLADCFDIFFQHFLQEGGREKSFRYWPRLGSRHNTVTYGRFKITTRFRTDSGCYATTGLKIKHLLTGQERTVWHLQYTDWPDHSCPEDFKGFLGRLNKSQMCINCNM